MSIFLKPTSSFEQANFEGEFTFVRSTKNEIYISDPEGNEFKIYKALWNDTLSSGQWIKIGARCSRVSTPNASRTVMVNIDLSAIRTTLLSELPVTEALYRPIKTGAYIDNLWSRKGGVMPGTITMVTGDPGIGKSSVMMSILEGVKTVNPEKKVLYVSGMFSCFYSQCLQNGYG